MKTIALVGNPNCGKTSLFNVLTGEEQKVGNWPGVTVEKKTGMLKNEGLSVVDLPGVYSLSPYSPEEAITRDYLLSERPDLILNLIDGTNLQRNLYLTEQLLTLEIPMVAAVTFMDEVEASGKGLNAEALSNELGVSAIPVSSRTMLGIDSLISVLKENWSVSASLEYEAPVEDCIQRMMEMPELKVPRRFYAEKYLEGDNFKGFNFPEERKKLHEVCNIDGAAAIASARYDIAERISHECLYVIKNKPTRFCDHLDAITLHPVLGIPMFFIVLIGMFAFAFGPVGQFLTECIDYVISSFVIPKVSRLLGQFEVSSWISQMILQAVIGGVGSVVKFVPQIGLLFFCLSFLEDSGYLARGAFLMDGFLKRMGLSGKAFLPMMMGFGCTASAVMATRAEENSKEREKTVFLLPFLSCGAKSTVYALFVHAFFPEFQGHFVFIIYLLGIIIAVLLGILSKRLCGKSESSGFVMELPAYRMPEAKSLLKSSWRPCKDFLIRAGTLIFVMNIVVWFFQSITPDFRITADSSESLFAFIGKTIAPLFIPLGFGEWQSVVSLLSGIVAKEGIVSSFCVLYNTSSYALEQTIKTVFTPLSAVSYLVFTMLYMPCISAIVTILKENGWKSAIKTVVIQTLIAYILALIVFQVGSVLGF